MSRKWIAGFIGTMLCLTAAAAVTNFSAADASSKLVFSAAAEEEATVSESGILGEAVTFTLYEDGLLVIGGEGSMDAEIADKITNKSKITAISIGKQVTSIAGGVLNGCTNLTELVVPGNVKTIADSAFSGCTSLKKAAISEGVESIGKGIFTGCFALESVSLPFAGESLEAVNDDTSLPIANLLFDYHSSNDAYYINVKGGAHIPNVLTKITITGSTKIPYMAFAGLTSLTTINLADSVTTLGERCLEGCSGLSTLNCNQNLDTIERQAFCGCTALKSVAFAYNTKHIGNQAFYGCAGLTELHLTNKVESIGESILTGCFGIKEVTLPYAGESLAKTEADETIPLSNLLFGYCSSDDAYYINVKGGAHIPNVLTKITITGGTKLPTNAFAQISSLTEIVLSDSVKELGKSSFADCTGLKTLIVAPYLEKIGVEAFINCTGLENVNFACEAKEICDRAFCQCSGLTELTLTDKVEKIGKNILNGCFGIREVTLPYAGESLEKTEADETIPLSDLLFGYCSSNDAYYINVKSGAHIPNVLTKITITGGTKIPTNAFAKFFSLTEVRLADSIVDLGAKSFSDCTSLQKLECNPNLNSIGEESFVRCNGVVNPTFASNAKSIGARAFAECSNLKELYLSEKVESIGREILKGCFAVERVTLPFAGATSEQADAGEFDPLANRLFGYYSSTDSYYVNVNGGAHIPLALTEFCITGGTTLSEMAFGGLESLKTISIPETVTTIGKKAFTGCTGLEKLVIPASVTEIADNAFTDCSETLTLFGTKESAAAAFAEKNGFDFCAPAITCGGHSMALSESLNVVFDISAEDDGQAVDVTGLPMTVQYADGKTAMGVLKAFGTKTVISVAESAKNYADVISVSLLGETFSYSAKEYFADAAEAHKENESLLALLDATEEYCQSAAYFFRMRGAKAVNVTWTAEDEASLMQVGSAYDASALGDAFHAYSLLVANQVTVRLYAGSEGAYTDFGGFSPLKFTERRVYRTTEEETIYAPTVMNYIYTVLTQYGNNEELANVCKALYHYYVAAVNYTAAQ